MKAGTIVIYEGASQEQVNWGGNDDPRDLLQIGAHYVVAKVEMHSWHTKIWVVGFEQKKFNSASFSEAP